MNSLVYPISLEYIPNWGNWEVIRELVSNCKDTGADYTIEKINDDLIITDNGEGMAIRHLLLGTSEKSNKDQAIGQFGEGLKLALLVLTRDNHLVDIFSGTRHIINGTDTIDNTNVLKLTWEDCEPVTGTKIIIHDWTDETYENRFLFDPDDLRVITNNDNGEILEDDSLYVKGVFVNKLINYRFGYNINKITMNRDRSAVSEYETQESIGKIWQNVESATAWKWFFEATNQIKMENMIHISSWAMTDKTKTAIINGFTEVFGNNAVIGTDENFTREAKHRGAKVISIESFGYYLRNALESILKTDKQYVMEKGGLKPKPVTKLSPEQRKILNTLRKMARKLTDFTITAGELPNDATGSCDMENKIIWIDVNNLYDLTTSGSTIIHEMAHAIYFTSDMTEEHVKAMGMIGMKLSGLV